MVDKVSLIRQPEVRLDSLGGSAKDLQTSSEFNELYRKAKGIQEFGNSRFESIDVDKNGYMTLPEIQKAKEAATDSNEKANLETFEKNYKPLSYVTGSKNTWDSGISRLDLDTLKNVMQPSGPKNYMEFEKIYAAGLMGAGGTFATAFFGFLAVGPYPRAVFAAAAVAGVAASVGGYFFADKVVASKLEFQRNNLRTMLRNVEIR